jgi:hypothetical protein
VGADPDEDLRTGDAVKLVSTVYDAAFDVTKRRGSTTEWS